jgi:ribosomal protein L37AE/L43A
VRDADMLYEIESKNKQKRSKIVCTICKNDGKLARSSKGIYESPADEHYQEDPGVLLEEEF